MDGIGLVHCFSNHGKFSRSSNATSCFFKSFVEVILERDGILVYNSYLSWLRLLSALASWS
jgi:hypothetical protein